MAKVERVRVGFRRFDVPNEMPYEALVALLELRQMAADEVVGERAAELALLVIGATLGGTAADVCASRGGPETVRVLRFLATRFGVRYQPGQAPWEASV